MDQRNWSMVTDTLFGEQKWKQGLNFAILSNDLAEGNISGMD